VNLLRNDDTGGVLRFLGTGASLGVPVVGCNCSVCHSTNWLNRRLRSSVLISIGKAKIVIDVGPDFRSQALAANVTHLDGVIITHSHHDHTASMDELRAFTHFSGHPLPILFSQATLNDLKIRFYYILGLAEDSNISRNHFDVQILPSHSGAVCFLGNAVKYVSYLQGSMEVNGFRFGDLAYITDIKSYNEEIFDFLKGVKTLVLGVLRHAPSALHLSIDEAIAFAKRCGAEQTWFTHLSHEIGHEETSMLLPPGISLSYDGLEIPFQIFEE